MADDDGIVYHFQGRQDAPAISLKPNFGQCLEALGTIQIALTMQLGNVLPVRIDGHATRGERYPHLVAMPYSLGTSQPRQGIRGVHEYFLAAMLRETGANRQEES